MSDTVDAGFKPLSRTGWPPALAQDIPEGWYVNLGIGIPTAGRRPRAARPRGDLPFRERHPRHGPGAAEPHKDNPWLINASKQHVTLRPAAASSTMPTASR